MPNGFTPAYTLQFERIVPDLALIEPEDDVYQSVHIVDVDHAVVVHVSLETRLAATTAGTCVLVNDLEFFPHFHSTITTRAAVWHVQVAEAMHLYAAEDAGIDSDGPLS